MNSLQNKPGFSHHNNFHLLRHFAAFLVLYAHCITATGKPEFIFSITKGQLELSSLGVDIFFIISGYLVTQSRLQTGGRIKFALKRMLRLWPALFVTSFLLAFVAGPLFTVLPLSQYFSSGQTWQFFLRNILFLPVYQLPGVFGGQGINYPFWTLFYELLCYTGLFLASKSLLSNHKKWWMVIWLLLIVARFWPEHVNWPTVLAQYRYGIAEMMFLFFSAAMYRLLLSKRESGSTPLIIAGLLLFCFSLAIPFPPFLAECFKNAGLLVFIIEFGKAKPLVKWPSWDISYGSYLVAFPVQVWVMYRWPIFSASATGIFLATLLVTIPLAFASWWLVEKPALSKKTKLR